MNSEVRQAVIEAVRAAAKRLEAGEEGVVLPDYKMLDMHDRADCLRLTEDAEERGRAARSVRGSGPPTQSGRMPQRPRPENRPSFTPTFAGGSHAGGERPAAPNVRAAIVTVEPIDGDGARGQGVLVTGGLVLTAAHCVKLESVVGAALGDRVMVWVTPPAGERFRMAALCLEPFADVAVLGPADDQDMPNDAEAFARFADATTPLQLHAGGLPEGGVVLASVYAHTGETIPAKARRMIRGDRTVWVETDQPIRGGTSGGPITTDDGELVAVVSIADCGTGISDGNDVTGTVGPQPYPARALPVWVVERVTPTAGEK